MTLKKKEIPTCLFLDIGGVLLSDGWDHHARKLAAMHFRLERVEMEHRHRLTFETYEVGKFTLDDYLTEVIFYKKRSFSRTQFWKFMCAQSTPHLQMIDLIAELKQQHQLKVAAVSNEARELNAYRIKTFHLDRIIDFYISSCFVHLHKPDADIFRLALDISNVPPKHVVYIENTAMFVNVAKKLGLQCIQHIDFKTTVKMLADLGLQTEGASYART